MHGWRQDSHFRWKTSPVAVAEEADVGEETRAFEPDLDAEQVATFVEYVLGDRK